MFVCVYDFAMVAMRIVPLRFSCIAGGGQQQRRSVAHQAGLLRYREASRLMLLLLLLLLLLPIFLSDLINAGE